MASDGITNVRVKRVVRKMVQPQHQQVLLYTYVTRARNTSQLEERWWALKISQIEPGSLRFEKNVTQRYLIYWLEAPAHVNLKRTHTQILFRRENKPDPYRSTVFGLHRARYYNTPSACMYLVIPSSLVSILFIFFVFFWYSLRNVSLYIVVIPRFVYFVFRCSSALCSSLFVFFYFVFIFFMFVFSFSIFNPFHALGIKYEKLHVSPLVCSRSDQSLAYME